LSPSEGLAKFDEIYSRIYLEMFPDAFLDWAEPLHAP
jgi:hypothetical protein